RRLWGLAIPSPSRSGTCGSLPNRKPAPAPPGPGAGPGPGAASTASGEVRRVIGKEVQGLGQLRIGGGQDQIGLHELIVRQPPAPADDGQNRLQLPPEGFLIAVGEDRKSTRLNSSHVKISYAV